MASRNVTIVAGQSGSGKTTFVLRFLANAPIETHFIFDPTPNAEFDTVKPEFAARLRLSSATTLHQLGLGLCAGWICFDPGLLFPGQRQTGFEFFCEYAFAKSLKLPGRKVLVIDEGWQYQTPQGIPNALACCVQEGRKRGLEVMTLSQRPHRFNDAIRGECSEFVAFSLNAPKALEVLDRDFGFDPEQVKALPRLHWISRDVDTGGELRGRIKI